MLMLREKRPDYRTIERWAIRILNAAHAIHECEAHGYIKDRADPHAWERALTIAKEQPLAGLSPDDAVAAVHDVLGGIGDVCPDCE